MALMRTMSCTVVQDCKCSFVYPFGSYTCANHSLTLMPCRRVARRCGGTVDRGRTCADDVAHRRTRATTLERGSQTFRVTSILSSESVERGFASWSLRIPRSRSPERAAESGVPQRRWAV